MQTLLVLVTKCSISFQIGSGREKEGSIHVATFVMSLHKYSLSHGYHNRVKSILLMCHLQKPQQE